MNDTFVIISKVIVQFPSSPAMGYLTSLSMVVLAGEHFLTAEGGKGAL